MNRVRNDLRRPSVAHGLPTVYHTGAEVYLLFFALVMKTLDLDAPSSLLRRIIFIRVRYLEFDVDALLSLFFVSLSPRFINNVLSFLRARVFIKFLRAQFAAAFYGSHSVCNNTYVYVVSTRDCRKNDFFSQSTLSQVS